MTLSDTCTPRREALTQGGEEKGSYSYHTHARHTCVHTHSARAHTCMHTVLMCTRIRPHAQTHMTKSRSGESRAEQRFCRKTELMEPVETWVSVPQGRERGRRAWSVRPAPGALRGPSGSSVAAGLPRSPSSARVSLSPELSWSTHPLAVSK